MIKKTIKYTDYNGTERTEDFWFNLNTRELANLELKSEGGFEGMIRQMMATTDIPKLTDLFEKIVLASYGEISPDGKRFIKKDGELAKEFVETEAYVQLYLELISDANKLSAFINGIVPKNIAQNMNSDEAKKKIEELKKEYHIEQ